MLKAIAEGQTDPATVVALADEKLQATPEQLRDALGVCREPPLPAANQDGSGKSWYQSTSELSNSTRRWLICSAGARTKSSGSRRYPA